MKINPVRANETPKTGKARRIRRNRPRPSPFGHIAGAALALALTLPGPAQAEADGPDFLRVVGVRPGSGLSLRAGPGVAYPRLLVIPAGSDGLANLGCRGGPTLAEWQGMSAAERTAAARRRWCRVRYRGVTGWAAGRYLGEGQAPAHSAPGPAVSAEPARDDQHHGDAGD